MSPRRPSRRPNTTLAILSACLTPRLFELLPLPRRRKNDETLRRLLALIFRSMHFAREAMPRRAMPASPLDGECHDSGHALPPPKALAHAHTSALALLVDAYRSMPSASVVVLQRHHEAAQKGRGVCDAELRHVRLR